MRKYILIGVSTIALAAWSSSTVVAEQKGKQAGGAFARSLLGGGLAANLFGGGHHNSHHGGGHHDSHHGGGHHDSHHGGGQHHDYHYDYHTYPDYHYVQPRTTYYQPPTNQLPGYGQGSGLPIKIVNPSANRVSIVYALNHHSYTIRPGYTQTIVDNGSWTIEFDRGGGLGVARYTMQTGSYTFRPTSRGWELYHGPLQSIAVAPAPVPAQPIVNPPAVSPPQQIAPQAIAQQQVARQQTAPQPVAGQSLADQPAVNPPAPAPAPGIRTRHQGIPSGQELGAADG